MWRYWVDWFLAPLAASIALYTAPPHSCLDVSQIAFGAVLFTFVEYWSHRILLHKLFWHGDHERHHLHPEIKTVFPLWYTPSLFAAFLIVLPTLIWAGMLIGYCWFLFWHHALHFWKMEEHPWVAKYANWHNVHHAGEPANYGITVPIWDFIFLTYKRAP